MNKKILYVDMDGVLCDYKSAFIKAKEKTPEIIYPQSQIGFFMNLNPLPMTYDMDFYYDNFDTYILTRPSVKNPLCYTEKRLWIEKHLGIKYSDKLIITPNKTLNKGDYLVDDNFWEFDGKLLLLGSDEFPSFNDVFKYLQNNK